MSNAAIKEGIKDTAAIQRREFGALELKAQVGEIQGNATAASAAAAVQARYIMAMQRPRDMTKVRQDILAEVSDPEFALDKSALYSKPTGGKQLEGLGIRFAEAAARCFTNVLIEAPTVYEDDTRRQIRVTVTDLESNFTSMKDIVVNKTVERKAVSKDDTIISFRTNSEGQTTYTIPATEDSMYNKENAGFSKAMRNGVLKLIPIGIQNECKKRIKEIREADVKKDPKAAEKAIVDSFARLNVTVKMLEEFLEHPVAQCTPAEIVNLQALYGALRDGEATWKSIMDEIDEYRKLTPKGKAAAAAAAAEPETKEEVKGVDATKEAARKVDEEKENKKSATKKKEKVETKTEVADTKPEEKAAAEPATKTEPEKPVDNVVPWAKEKTAPAPVAETETVDADNGLDIDDDDDGIDEQESAATEKVEPVASKNPEVHKVTFPEHINVLSQAELPSPEAIAEMTENFEKLCAVVGPKSLETTVTNFCGIEVSLLNSEAVAAFSQIFQNILAKATKK